MTALSREAAKRGLIAPKPVTLAKYGMSETEWLRMLSGQGWECPICGKVPKTGRFVTDHEHVRGWKAMPDEQRKKYVRGITCWMCNRYLLARGISIEVATNVTKYLTRYDQRRPK